MNNVLELIEPLQSKIRGTGSLYRNTTQYLEVIEEKATEAYMNYSEYAFRQLTTKLDLALKTSGYRPSFLQSQAIEEVLFEISSNDGYNISELQIKVSG